MKTRHSKNDDGSIERKELETQVASLSDVRGMVNQQKKKVDSDKEIHMLAVKKVAEIAAMTISAHICGDRITNDNLKRFSKDFNIDRYVIMIHDFFLIIMI